MTFWCRASGEQDPPPCDLRPGTAISAQHRASSSRGCSMLGAATLHLLLEARAVELDGDGAPLA